MVELNVELTDGQIAHLDELDARVAKEAGLPEGTNVGLSGVGNTLVAVENSDVTEANVVAALEGWDPPVPETTP